MGQILRKECLEAVEGVHVRRQWPTTIPVGVKWLHPCTARGLDDVDDVDDVDDLTAHELA